MGDQIIEPEPSSRGAQVSADDLLLSVPDFSSWSSANPGMRPQGHGMGDFEAVLAAYFEEFRIELDAFDDDGVPIWPTDEHILDDLARRYDLVDEETSALRPAAGTVAVLNQLPECDRCESPARYETYINTRQGRTAAAVCTSCLRTKGDPLLGPGHSVLLVLLDEISSGVRQIVEEVLTDQGTPTPWNPPDDVRAKPTDGHQAFRRWGFTEPNSLGQMRAVIFGADVAARPHTGGGVLVSVRHQDERTWLSLDHVVPPDFDGLEVRQLLLHDLRGVVPSGRESTLAEYFAVPIEESERCALRSIDEGTYHPYLHHDGLLGGPLVSLPLTKSAERSAAEEAAAGSAIPYVIYRLAKEHPEPEVRALAIGNPCCPADTVLEAASTDGHWQIRDALSSRQDLPAGALRCLVTSILMDGRLDQHFALRVIVRSDCPDELVDRLVDRLHDCGTDARIQLAEELHRGPVARRDAVHTTLLTRARRGPSTPRLIEAVLGEQGVAGPRLGWLQEHPSLKVRRHISEYIQGHAVPVDESPKGDDDRAGSAHGQEVGNANGSPRAPSAGLPELAPEPGTTAPAALLSAVAIAVRLRRMWIGEVPTATELRLSDLADGWRDVMLRRTGTQLELYLPYNFGDGDPLAGGLGDLLTRRVVEVSQGSVREVVWRFDPRTNRPVRRPQSTDLDIYAPEDPDMEEYTEVVARLRDVIPKDTSDVALEVLHRLSLVGVSKHRLWLAAPTSEEERAIAKTPGAAYSLHTAVQRLQKKDPLYRVVVDSAYGDPTMRL